MEEEEQGASQQDCYGPFFRSEGIEGCVLNQNSTTSTCSRQRRQWAGTMGAGKSAELDYKSCSQTFP